MGTLKELFKSNFKIGVEWDDFETQKKVQIHRENGTRELPLFIGNETVKGNVHVVVLPGKKIEHKGIKIEMIGQIDLFYDRGQHYEFISLLERPLLENGILEGKNVFPFEFVNAEKPHESYNGLNARLRYLLRVTISRKFLPNIVEEFDFWVHKYSSPPSFDKSIKMEVGINDNIHIEFEYNKHIYHLKDVIIGKIYFILVRIKIKKMELALYKQESTGTAQNVYNESLLIGKFEIMDGAPVKGESIPVRLHLGGFDITPTYNVVQNKFSVRYFLHLVIFDEEERKYFKQQEITLWRKPPKKKKIIQKTEATTSSTLEKNDQEENLQKEKDSKTDLNDQIQ